MAFKNKEDKRKYDREYHAKRSVSSKLRKLKLQKERKQRITKIIRDYKFKIGCDCGENNPLCLDFHHLGKDKKINIADAVRCGWSLIKIFKEIKKCKVICANCHRKITMA